MKKLFYSGLASLALFEIARVYLIMPMPGSQRVESLDTAYFLHVWRWVFRAAFLLMIVAGCGAAFRVRRKWVPASLALVAAVVAWLFNFEMTADHMFTEPHALAFTPRAASGLDDESVIIAIENGGEAKAYPVRYLVFHHQVRDTVGGRPVIVTYCSVCRTGRVFEPVVRGSVEKFRLVGMDHFNAMFEDATTGSWWRQSTGEAVAGPLKGETLPEIGCSQLSLGKWAALHPAGLVMQPDAASEESYDKEGKFERGESKGDLTRTERASWQDKSWVVGIRAGAASKAYDWNRLVERRVINDTAGDTPIVLALAEDGQSFAAFERPVPTDIFTLNGDVLSANGRSYDFHGRNVAVPAQRLKPVMAFQEFWHSWRTFQPGTEKYE